MKLPLLGGHVSVAGGLWNAFKNAAAIGAQSIQIFGANPRGWGAPMPNPETIEKFKLAWKESSVKEVYLHAGYLPNIASPDEVLRMKSLQNLIAHLKIADLLGAQGLIIHVGSGKELPREEARVYVIGAIQEMLKHVPGETMVLIENMAGGGERIGATPEELGILLRAINSPRVKICFDTAHAFEAGIIEEYAPKNIKKLFDTLEKEVGLVNIRALHVNDSKTPYNSHHDRHENLGQGYIGLKGFRELAQEKRIHHTAWLLEVPGFDDNGPDEKNIKLLADCFKK